MSDKWTGLTNTCIQGNLRCKLYETATPGQGFRLEMLNCKAHNNIYANIIYNVDGTTSM